MPVKKPDDKVHCKSCEWRGTFKELSTTHRCVSRTRYWCPHCSGFWGSKVDGESSVTIY
jgi:DnaJ-class molecular chaperone